MLVHSDKRSCGYEPVQRNERQRIVLKMVDPETKYRCDSKHCEEKGKLCCRRYSIIVSEDEAHKITEILPEIRKLHRIDVAALADDFPFEEIEEDTFEVEQSEKYDACAFLTYDDNGTPLCGIHATCNNLGIDYREYKPSSCRLFPLEAELNDDETEIHLEWHEDKASLPCLNECATGAAETVRELVEFEMKQSISGQVTAKET